MTQIEVQKNMVIKTPKLLANIIATPKVEILEKRSSRANKQKIDKRDD